MSRRNPRPRENMRPRPTVADCAVRLEADLPGSPPPRGVIRPVAGVSGSPATSVSDGMSHSYPVLRHALVSPGQEIKWQAGALQIAHGYDKQSTDRARRKPSCDSQSFVAAGGRRHPEAPQSEHVLPKKERQPYETCGERDMQVAVLRTELVIRSLPVARSLAPEWVPWSVTEYGALERQAQIERQYVLPAVG